MVQGLFGVSNISQLLVAVEDLKGKRCSLVSLTNRVDMFLEIWEDFAERWALQDQQVIDIFGFEEDLRDVYKGLLEQLEKGLDNLIDALDLVEALQEESLGSLDLIDEYFRHFFRHICSSAAGIFTKLDSRDGDFGGLMSAFGSL